jgi:hypothetical protein
VTRGVDDLLADLAEVVDAAAELVKLGKRRWDSTTFPKWAMRSSVGSWGKLDHA